MSELIQARATDDPYLIVLTMVLFLLPLFKFWEEIRRSLYSTRKDKIENLLVAVKGYLKGKEHRDYLKYKLELAFQAHYGKALAHYEIAALLKRNNPQCLIKRYLSSAPYLKLSMKDGIAKRFHFKSKQKRYPIPFTGKRWRVHTQILISYFFYFVLAMSGGLILAYGLPVAIHSENIPITICIIIIGGTLLLGAFICLREGVKFDAARKFVAEQLSG